MGSIDKTIIKITVPTPLMVGDTHVYLIKDDLLTLVDAGVKTKEAWEALKFQLKEHGYFPNDIEQIILTHHHPDHIGLIEQFPRAEKLIAHKNVDFWLTRDEQFLQRYEHFFEEFFVSWGVPQCYQSFLNKLRDPLVYAGKGKLTNTIIEGDTIPGHEDWQVIETKGHAQSHVSFFREKDGLFIGGDHLLHHISPNPLLEAPYDNEKERARPILQYRTNLKKCLSLGIKTVLPGHGENFSDVEALIQLRLHKQEQRANKVYLLLKEKEQTPFQICQKIFPKQYNTQLDLTMSETVGQLDYLENEGLIKKINDNGVIYYYAKCKK